MIEEITQASEALGQAFHDDTIFIRSFINIVAIGRGEASTLADHPERPGISSITI